MTGTYSTGLVFLSVLVAILASYTALDLVKRISMLQTASQRYFWLIGGAVAMGVGIWSMHFVGMLAFSLPVPVGYDIWITLLSLGIAIMVSCFALYTVTQGTMSVKRLVAGGVLMGLGISTMHYAGMAAMMIPGGISYVPWIFATSVLIAIAASMAALRIAFTLRTDDERYAVLRKAGAAVVMGFAITGMHYTGMAAARFPAEIVPSTSPMDNTWLALTIAVLTCCVLAIALILSMLDARLESRTTKLANSLKSANDMLTYLATHDALTGLPNRMVLTDRIQRALHASRRRDRPCAIIYIDLDGFKPVNDSLGHSVGDAVLKAVTGRLLDILRKEDTLSRISGDEFVMLVEDLNHTDDAMDVCERILAAVHEPLDVGSVQLHVTASIGISLFPHDGNTVETLLQSADAAMNEVKKSGRNGYRYFETTMNANALRTLRIQADLRNAVDNDELTLYFQPKFSRSTRELIGAEALLRWNHAELGWISPNEFIPVAERSGLILEIGEWVINETCRQLVAWMEARIEPVKIAVNLSPKQLHQRNLAHRIAGIVRKHGLEPALLILEITETAAMEDAKANVVAIHQLQSLGFDVAIDDFGTGYSSLSYLQQFRAQQLKIDRCFVEGLDRGGDEGLAIVSAVIAMAHALRMEVVAEGVETASQLDKLNRLGCDQLQGYLLGKPMPAEDFAALLSPARNSQSAQVAGTGSG